ncbi:MarR family transcriptional regulator [Roseobacter cerasinus]|uniref:MarR family transcriptional regulator n=1 Tax=Roseobacter cerasinus TaxID=2602289 RepID=A0A640VTG4_9RHOB|nr:MarR family transcriptional regulator [Roseobacter cerasinus]GFE50884.1 MarR family transcriptional regulator [Roseobacter cerasinus]
MNEKDVFDLQGFLPYILNQAAERASLEFQTYYKSRYGMLRTEWRVLFHLGRYGRMQAKEICQRARIHKTKVSRAVSALEHKRLLSRTDLPEDRRGEYLMLTTRGGQVFGDLCQEAQRFDANMLRDFTLEEQTVLRRVLIKLAQF